MEPLEDFALAQGLFVFASFVFGDDQNFLITEE
jgi:hypothetical protein